MKHARPDYDRIVDPAGMIPEHEPVFLLRGQDTCAPAAIDAWIRAAAAMGVAPMMIKAAAAQRNRMIEWQDTHKSKKPDMPAPPASAPQAPFRYDLAELDTMRKYIGKDAFPHVGPGMAFTGDERLQIEDRLRTFMLAGVTVADFERRYGPV